jgi:hypothetical protein
MITAVAGAIAFGLLFAAFGLIGRERSACGGSCGSCAQECERRGDTR